MDRRLSDPALEPTTDEGRRCPNRGEGHRAVVGPRFLLIALNRPDVFLTGDIALRRAIQRICGFDHVPSEAELVEIRTDGGRIAAWP